MTEPPGNARVTCAPDDVRSSMLWFDESGQGFTRYSAYPNPDGHERGCRVYWGSHGCERPYGHKGPHWCDCCDCEPGTHPADGCVAGPPYYGWGTLFFGADVPWWRGRFCKYLRRLKWARVRRRRPNG